MEEKFDEEFKRKVKGINPEIPYIVRMRIDDTLASLPEKRMFWRTRNLAAAAAIFLVFFIGIRYIYPMQSAREIHPKNVQNSTMTAAGTQGNEKTDGKKDYTINAKTSEDKTVENNTSGNSNKESSTNNTTYGVLKSAPAAKTEGTDDASAGTAPEAGTDMQSIKMSFTGSVIAAEDQGIKLILKTAAYDGKEIRIEFARNSAKDKILPDSSAQMDNNLKSERSPQVNVVEKYGVRVVIDNIPLKCSLNILESSEGENQYSGTLIIIPDSELPEKFDMILNFDKVDDLSGKWVLTAQVSKK